MGKRGGGEERWEKIKFTFTIQNHPSYIILLITSI